MPEIPAGRYRGTIVSRETINAGGYDLLKLGFIVSELWEALATQWLPVPEPTIIEATWFLRGQNGLDKNVLESFAVATGWNKDPNQFRDDNWKPNPVQVVVSTKPNKKGDGVYYNIQAMAPHDAERCESKGANSSPSILDRAVEEWTGKIPPQPPVIPKPKADPPQEGVPF